MPEQSNSKKVSVFHSKAALNFYQQAWESDGKYQSPATRKRTTSNACKVANRGPKLAACYLCGNMYSLHSFPIHLPQCYAKKLVAWERAGASARGLPPNHPEDVVSLPGLDVSPRSLQAFNEQQLEICNGPRRPQQQQRKRSVSRERATRSPTKSSPTRVSTDSIQASRVSPAPKPALNPPFRSQEIHEVPVQSQAPLFAPPPPSPPPTAFGAFFAPPPGAVTPDPGSLCPSLSCSPTPSGSLMRQFALSDMQQKLYTPSTPSTPEPKAPVGSSEGSRASDCIESASHSIESAMRPITPDVPMLSSLPAVALEQSVSPAVHRPTPSPQECADHGNLSAPLTPSRESSSQDCPASPYSETLRNILNGMNSLAKQIKQRNLRGEFDYAAGAQSAPQSVPLEPHRVAAVPYYTPANIPQNPYKRHPSPVGIQEVQYHTQPRVDRFVPTERPAPSPTPSAASSACRPCHSFTPIYPPSSFGPPAPGTPPAPPSWAIAHPLPSPMSVLSTPTPTLAYTDSHSNIIATHGHVRNTTAIANTASQAPVVYQFADCRPNLPFSLPENYSVPEITCGYACSTCSSSPRQSPAGSLLEERCGEQYLEPASTQTRTPIPRPASGSPKRHSPPPRPGACKVPPSPSIVPVKPEKRVALRNGAPRDSNASDKSTPRLSPANQ